MNVLVGILLLVLCVYCGYKFSEKYTLRAKFYLDFFNFNEKVKNEVLYTQNTLMKIVETIDNESEFYRVVKNNVGQVVQVNVEYLTKEENNHIYNYFNSVGSGDGASQMAFLNCEKEIIESKKKQNGRRKD